MAKQQLVIVLCEGPHDVAFLVRILKCEGFESNESSKIGDFPPPLNNLLKTEAQKSNVESLNLQEVRRVLLPTNTLKRDENYLFLYALGGDGKKEERQKMLKTLLSYIPTNPGEIRVLPNDTKLALIYVFDADNAGVANRITEINREISVVLSTAVNTFSTNAETRIVNEILMGNYVFAARHSGKGKLEDILVPLMRKMNERIFDGARRFLKRQFKEDRLFKLVLKKENNIIKEERSVKAKDKHKFDRSKSYIGVVGQLQKSGGSNVVAISDTDYLTYEKIKENATCQEIAQFFNGFL